MFVLGMPFQPSPMFASKGSFITLAFGGRNRQLVNIKYCWYNKTMFLGSNQVYYWSTKSVHTKIATR